MKSIGIFCFAILILVSITGCVLPFTGGAGPEINYLGQLPKTTTIDHAQAVEFANDFAFRAGITVSDVWPKTGFSSHKRITVFFNNLDPVWVTIFIDNSKNQLWLTVRGDINSPTAKRITDEGVELFQKKFPEGNIALYAPHKNWFERILY